MPHGHANTHIHKQSHTLSGSKASVLMGVGWGLRQHPWWQPRQRAPCPHPRPPHGPQMGVRWPPPAPSPVPPASLTNLCDGKGAGESPGVDSSKKAPVCLCPAAFRASAVAPLGGPGLVRIGATGGIRGFGGMKDAPVGGDTWTPAGQYFRNISDSFGGSNTKVQPPRLIWGPPGAEACLSIHQPALGRAEGRGPWRPPSAGLSWLPCLPGGHQGLGSMQGPAAQRCPIMCSAWPGSN